MTPFNVPDDWGMYYSNCPRCNARTHASERYSCACDDYPSEGEPESDEVEFLCGVPGCGDEAPHLDPEFQALHLCDEHQGWVDAIKVEGDRDGSEFVTADGYRLAWNGDAWTDGDLSFEGTEKSGPLRSPFRWFFEGTDAGGCGDGCHRCSVCKLVWSETGGVEVKGDGKHAAGAHDCEACNARCVGLGPSRLGNST